GPGADAEEDRVVALSEQVVDREVAPELHPALELGIAELPDRVQLLVELHLREAVLRDAVAEHAALLLHHLEHRDRVTLQRRVIRAGEASRAGADHGDALAGRRLLTAMRRSMVHTHHSP